jgi:hypothetical protein
METSFHYDLGGPGPLNFKLRQKITAKPGVELKGKGYFNTATGSASYTGTLTASAAVQGADDVSSGSSPLKLCECAAVCCLQ